MSGHTNPKNSHGARWTPIARALALCAATGFAGSAMAQTAPTPQQLEQQIQALQDQVQALKAAQAQAPAAAPSSGASDGLTFHGLTLYGTLDGGLTHMTNGAALNSDFGPGVPYLIAKYAHGSTTSFAPSGLSQSLVGLKGDLPVDQDLFGFFKVETAINPQSGTLYNAEKSLVQQNGRPLASQTTNGDSANDGQIFTRQAYLGFGSNTYGTIQIGRINNLLNDALTNYDPLGKSYAFSPLGYSGATAGGGYTEETILDNSLRYAVNVGPAHIYALHQVQADGAIPGGANQFGVGGGFAGFNVDLTYSKIYDAISASALSAAQNVSPNYGTLAAKVSDNTAWALEGNYKFSDFKAYAGYEHINFADPSDPLKAGVTNIGGYTLSFLTQDAFKNNEVLEISWLGLSYAITPKLLLTGAYYHLSNNSYKGNGCSNTSASSCSGEENVYSLVLDYHFLKNLDVYGGFMSSKVENGMASGFLEDSNLATTIGLRLMF